MVYSSIASHSYFALNVNQAYLDDNDCLHCKDNGTLALSRAWDYSSILGGDMQAVALMMHEKWKNGTLDRLENEDCINQYGTMIQSYHRNLLLVSSNDHTETASKLTASRLNGSHVFNVMAADAALAEDQTHAMLAYDWICMESNTTEYSYIEDKDPSWCADKLDGLKSNASSWTVGGYPIKYCLR